MAKRKRAHIPLQEKLAAALAQTLPQEQRDDLRTRRVPARDVIKLFTPDHITLHCFGGKDQWWNLDMRLRGLDLKAKDARDTSIAAKAVRIDGKWRAFTLGMQPAKRKKPPSRWPKRSFAKRAFRV